MNQIITPTGVEIMLVEVPEEAYQFCVYRIDGINYMLSWEIIHRISGGVTELGNQLARDKNLTIELLGTITKGVPDFECESLVEKQHSQLNLKSWMNYLANEFSSKSPSDSFISFLSKEGIPMDRKYCVLKIVKS